MVRVALCVPPRDAAIVDAVVELTGFVAMVNDALLCPSGTTTLCGTTADALLLERNTPAPPAGAGMLSATVAVDDVPPCTDAGASASDETDNVGLLPHIPGVPPPPQVRPKLHPHASVPPQPSAAEQTDGGRSRQVFGEHPAVTVRGLVNGACPAAPELAEMSTVVCVATDFDAWMVSAPPPLVHPPKTNGWPPLMIEATDGSLLVAEICTPEAGAIFCRTTSMKDTPPAATVEGVSVNDASGGGGGAVPPGFKVSVTACDTSSRATPDPSAYERSVYMTTGDGEVTTAVGIAKLADVVPAARSGTLQLARAATRSPRSILMFTIAPRGCASASDTVAVTSLPPGVDDDEMASGGVPEKQLSLSCDPDPVTHPDVHVLSSVQLFVVVSVLHL